MSTPAKHVSASPAPATATPLRFVTAASLFDGHDAAINIMRRIIQDQGAEVIHLGHNRSVEDVVRAALQEDADAIAISSYQGGHVEYFKYMVDMLKEHNASHIRVFGGGGGTITPEEIAELQDYGVERIYHPNDGMKLGLVEMIEDVVKRAGEARQAKREAEAKAVAEPKSLDVHDEISIGHMLSALEDERVGEDELARLRKQWNLAGKGTPVVGITGTGGAGKSSVVDELLLRYLHAFPKMRIAVLAVDPTRRRSGGALLGDRIRMNSLRSHRVFMRSMATRQRHVAINDMLQDCINFLRSQPYDLVIVETAGIGQSDSAIVDLVDFPMYVMTSDYGAASQLEKIDMVDFADLVVLNKFDRRGAEDALRDVRKQWKRNHQAWDMADDDIPVYPTIASQFNDPGVTWMFVNMCRLLRERGQSALSSTNSEGSLASPTKVHSDPTSCDFNPDIDTSLKEPRATVLIPGKRVRYLAEIAEQGRGINESIEHMAMAARKAQHYYASLKELDDPGLPRELDRYAAADTTADDVDGTLSLLRQRYNEAVKELTADAIHQLREWPERRQAVMDEVNQYQVRGKTIKVDNYRESLSHQQIPKIAPPQTGDWGEQLHFLMRENLPGAYPYTAGVYPYRRTGEDPIRMFAGEGTPERTNRRFHYLSLGQPAARLSTAFDSVTLYGEDPAERPDIYGKVGNSGVNIATLDDMKKLYSGFDLSAPTTSVSMTINGPAPMILAMFMNTAIDQNVERYLKEDDKRWAAAQKKLDELFADRERPQYHGDLPEGSDGLGLALLGVTGDQLVDADTYARIKAETVKIVRGTVQADILKEDQAQNTCIFSTEFALRMMGDVQEYFVNEGVRNFYSVSISGYHIAEAGANPISQLAFTLANGFTIVEYYLARGMDINAFAPNLSFFFSNGMDPEYTVIGRVARRIWSRAMRERYGANTRSQMMKYHIQTSGRSLHAQEIQFNDIRTTLQAMYALFDNCNSLHTNAYDEAITTPTEESVRRAVAIQMIINKELGLNFNENPWQGSYAVERLTDLVEEAVYKEFESISERGGVLGAMDTMYQRGKIQDESLYYEHKKHDGSLPLVGVNTFKPKDGGGVVTDIELIRSTPEEKGQQIENVQAFEKARNELKPDSLDVLQRTARERKNVFEQLMQAVKYNSLGQIS
ncbi:MAG TPA: methylmalonyl-CoA mutase family protein, partial [Oleiagrimonas sp.]|nr:methylmalonyl-CoA mutase family protein [Oleiagrimonas sp.]